MAGAGEVTALDKFQICNLTERQDSVNARQLMTAIDLAGQEV